MSRPPPAAASPRAAGGEADHRIAEVLGGAPARASTGVRTLMAAILYDAVCTAVAGEAGARQEALAWIDSRDTDWIFSFVSVCEVLRLSPTAVRLALRRQVGRASGRRRRVRTNSQRTAGGARLRAL